MNNFGDIPTKYSIYRASKIVILPVPFDFTSTWIKGANKGPKAIIEASANMELYDIETDSEVYKKGIYTTQPIKAKNPQSLVKQVGREAEKHIKKNKLLVVVGGEHSVSIGSIWAHINHYPDVSVLQLDAHSDLRDSFKNSKYNHACVMARIKNRCPIVQVGIRSMDISEKQKIDKDRCFFAQDIFGKKNWINYIIKKLTECVYVTVDLDVFDPSIMPSVGTPEPGGLGWYDVLELLKEVARQKRLIGFDVVELCPSKINKASDFLAAKLIYKILSYKFESVEQL